MTWFSVGLILSVSVLCSVPIRTAAQTPGVTQIKILSGWGGLGTPKSDELTITRKGDVYFAGSKRINVQLINNLAHAVSSPAIPTINLANLGITQAWLDANAEKGLKDYADSYYSSASPNQQALYLSTFRDVAFMKVLLPSLYPGMWTDDYPWFEVEVVKEDGTKIIATSKEKQLFMLPWEVTNAGRKIKTFNAEISRAVVALLPPEFTNRDRLSGDNLPYVLAKAVMQRIEDKWKLLDVENKASTSLRALERAYVIESAEINNYHNVDFGKEWVGGSSEEENLQVVLKRKDLPSNVQIGVVLPYKSGAVEGVNGFIANANHYIDLLLSVSWLKEFIGKNPRMNFELRFVRDRSFSEKAMQLFAADMRLKGKESLVTEVERVQKEVSLLAVGWKYFRDYWLILPDKRIVLWRFNQYRPPIKWETLKSNSWDCSNYQGRCLGAIISTEGAVIDK